jgi:tetratricopeptide (TPR) repeat protein
MKKTMMLALMAVAASTAFAQDALIKEAKKIMAKGEFDQASQTLAPALQSAETLDKKGAWNLESEIQYGKYIAIQTENTKNQVENKKVPYDTLGMHNAAVAAWKAALKCDEFDQQPDAKGKIKIKYRPASQNKFKNHGIALVQAGQYFYQSRKDNAAAFDAWSTYLDMKNSSIFAEVADFPKDPFFYDIAYYAAILSYQSHDYVNAEKYAKLTAEDTSKADEAMEILLFSKKETMKTAEDSAAYVNMVKDLHKQNPEEARYFNLLMDYYTRANDKAALKAWADEEIAMNASNKMAWALKGEVLMNNEEWDAAVECYQKAIEIDPEFLQCVFNAGVCYNSKAIALNDQLADKKTGGLTKENADKVKAVLIEAQSFLERARELDPNREKVNWAYPLYRIYYTMQNKEKMAELEAIDPSLK